MDQRKYRILLLPVVILFFMGGLGCSSSSSGDANGDTNTIAGAGGDPFLEILNYGVGAYSGSCMSIYTGLAVSGKQSSLTDAGALNGAEFTATVSRDNHILSFTQTFKTDKVSFDQAEWDAGPVPNKATEGLLLRYNTNAVGSDNLAHARKEDPNGDMGLSCNGAVTTNLVKSNMFTVFSKYLKNPKPVFTQCVCGNAGGGSTEIIPASEFSSSGSLVKIRALSIDLTQNFEEQTVSYNSQASDKNFIYTLIPSNGTIVLYNFNAKLELSKFMAQFASGTTCACQ